MKRLGSSSSRSTIAFNVNFSKKVILTFVYIFIYFMSKIIQIIICKDQSVFQIDNIINPTLSVLGNSIRKM